MRPAFLHPDQDFAPGFSLPSAAPGDRRMADPSMGEEAPD